MSARPRPVETYRRRWPGRAAWYSPGQPRAFHALGERLVLYLVVLSEVVGNAERLSLGAWSLYSGGTVLKAGVIHGDELAPKRVAELERWAAGRLLAAPRGPRPWRVLPVSEFNRQVLIGERALDWPRGLGAYRGGAVVVGLDLGHALSLLASHVAGSKGRRQAGGWSLGLAGLGVHETRQVERAGGRVAQRTRWWRAHPHAPRLYVRPAGSFGVTVSWASCGEGRGQWRRDQSGKLRPHRGEFIDVTALAHALDGINSADLTPHREVRRLALVEVPASVRADAAGAERLAAILDAVRELALALDQEGDGLDLGRLHSPGGVAGQLLGRLGVVPPLGKYGLPDDELGRWMATMFGGWITGELRGVPFPAADLDARSAFPAVFSLLDGWRHMTARTVRRRDETVALRTFLSRPDLADVLLDPATWRRWSLTVADVLPHDDHLPVAAPV